jgi:hypothetical protein
MAKKVIKINTNLGIWQYNKTKLYLHINILIQQQANVRK